MPLNVSLTESEQHPLLTDEGRHLLKSLYEHEHGPTFNHRCGDRLNEAGLAEVQAFSVAVNRDTPRWKPGTPPEWVYEDAVHCARQVPIYRSTALRADFIDIPTVSREQLGREPWQFVPDDAPLDDLILYDSTGTTGHPTDILCHPIASSKYLPIMQKALRMRGIKIDGGPGRVAIMLIANQRRTWTFASISAYLNQAAFAKVNLYPTEWRDPGDRALFLDETAPEIFTGDPIAFDALAAIPFTHQPKAMISTSMTLTNEHRMRLEERFGCPVLDMYSMSESGPIAIATPHGHQILAPDLYVEVLRPDGTHCAADEPGEITLTGGRNPFLKLLRYRTGDRARIASIDGVPTLLDFEGRPPVIYTDEDGEPINNVDIIWLLRPFRIARYRLHQAADRRVRIEVAGTFATPAEIRDALQPLFGAGIPIEVVPWQDTPDRVVQYTREESVL